MAHRWTPDEDATLRRMDAEGADYYDMAERLGRTPHATLQRLYDLRDPVRMEARRLAKIESQRAYEQRSREALARKLPPPLDEGLIARRAEAASLRPRDLTGLLMGDPPVGRSALDVRRHAGAA